MHEKKYEREREGEREICVDQQSMQALGDPSISALPSLRSQLYATAPNIYVGSRDPNSVHQAYTANKQCTDWPISPALSSLMSSVVLTPAPECPHWKGEL